MQKPPQRSTAELFDAYRDYLLSNVSKVYILGEADERELKEVFVELSIVEQRVPRQHAEFIGMLDAVMRRRFDPSVGAKEVPSPDLSGQSRVKPEDLLRHNTKAIVTGAPGSGKTTLLKYLSLKAQEERGRLAVWLELKSIDRPLFAEAERTAAHAGSLILPELWLKHLRAQLSLSDGETKLLRAYWQERFKANEIAVFIDGFDELQDEAIERNLNKCVREFASAAHENTLLISTRPYARHRLGKLRLQELEIEPLNQRQIKAFLNCYYPGNAATQSLLKTLRERSPLREMLHVPLLLGIIFRLHREGGFAGERLRLYETIVADLVDELDLSAKSINRQFKINDRRLRVDFLKFVAFERLLRDPLDEEEQEGSRIVFSYELLKEKARIFLAQERLSHSHRDLTDDALATPLLREIGSDTFAFTHLTLQEHLAARAFAAFYKSNQFEAIKIFCRTYHNPTLVEMDVLPMALGALANADRLYAEIEQWPESLNLTNLRLRARGLAYSAKLSQERVSKLLDRLFEMVSEENSFGGPLEAVLDSFAGVNDQTMALIEAKANLSLRSPKLLETAFALGRLGSDRAVEALMSVLHHENPIISQNADIRRSVFVGLSFMNSDKAVELLISGLHDEDGGVRSWSLNGLKRAGSDRAVEALVSAVKHPDAQMRYAATLGLTEVDYDNVADVVIPVLADKDPNVRSAAVIVLATLGSDKALDALISALGEEANKESFVTINLGLMNRSDRAVEALISALNDTDTGRVQRSVIATTLGMARSERAVGALSVALRDSDKDVRTAAAGALGYIGSDSAVEALVSALNDKHPGRRADAAMGLGATASARAARALAKALRDEDREVRLRAAKSLEIVESRRMVATLISALDGEDGDADSGVTAALNQFNYNKAVDALIAALHDKDKRVRYDALLVLGYVGSDKAVEAVVSNLSNEDDDLRTRAAMVLEAIRPGRVIGALTSALHDSDADVRYKAIGTLGILGSDAAVDALISALNHEDGEVCRKAAGYLSQMKGQDLIAGLERTLSQRDAAACQKAVTAIGYHSNDERTLSWLRELSLKHREPGVREAAGEAADKLTRKLELLGRVTAGGAAPSLGDNESRELFLIGEAFKVAAEAGHIFRPTPNSDWGIDGEIEFKNERGEASGLRVYLQLKSGDSYLRTRKMDGREIFAIKNPRHAEYWQSQRYPVMLVIRDSNGLIRWMDVTEYLQRHGTNIRQIEFQGEPFTAENVRQMRDRLAR